MIVCYLAAICPRKYFDRFEGEVSVAAYQFNNLLAQGFATLDRVEVKCLVPISLLNRMELSDLGQEVDEENVHYIMFNKDILDGGYGKFICEALKRIKEWKKRDDVVLVADALGVVADILSILAHRRYGVSTVGIITDLPQYVGNPQKWKEKLRYKLNLFLMRRFQSYVLLTEPMAEWVNRRHKPQCIVEGVCNRNDIQDVEISYTKYEKMVCMYAGSLHKEYGIDLLIDAFLKANIEDSELHIYGKGNYSDEIEKICEKYENVYYWGQQSYDRILQEERKATLLINPRPTNEEYTKYSFPSKTLEYMASGTPVLMTRLPGMPKDYEEYVYLFDEETVEGFANTLGEVLQSKSELQEKGKRAREFILTTRNNREQALRIIHELGLS